MTPGGWIIMIISVGGVTAFFAWTMLLVLTKKSAPEHLHSTMDSTPDIEE